ncbi:exostosin family protein [Rubellimicrobium sp. CFH 75288]|uniref:exostosin domain-containing protein n=1 Tax=Rubellimicrobium sp. CFH 75288 TaxID=2697034 RepID=UPI0014120522|nr:exostosin family protein [Rubellimicrobium sp. CFH 75288]NAZ36673.1 hypothetical protein [Rubellimicrobium sp. CFH 75288]
MLDQQSDQEGAGEIPEGRGAEESSAALLRPAPSPELVGGRGLFLFAPFYTPADPARADELLFCLDQNLACDLFARIILLMEDDTPLPRRDRRLGVLRLGRRPTYRDWVRAARRICPGHVAVLANSDIHFDSSIGLLGWLFETDPRAFVALTRFERRNGILEPHPDPHWSQDAWAMVVEPDRDEERLESRLDIPLGVPRCDNKVAYVLATEGRTVHNPFPHVRAVHVHESGLRYYSKKGDRRIIGGVAMVRPGGELGVPARLDVEIWAESASQMSGVRLNRTLERWAEEERLRSLPRPAWLAHDADWQHPAITEQHAFARMRERLPATDGFHRAVYLAFPFATLIDLMRQLGRDHPRTATLWSALAALRARVPPYDRVVTVAQHIRMAEHAEILVQAGVTDLFWSHAAIGQTALPEARDLRVHPFPLFPVQQQPRGAEDVGRPRRHLFSFVGARAQPNYLTQARTLIVDLLQGDPRGCVVDREGWHYQSIVYDMQVMGRLEPGRPDLVDESRSALFRDIMDESVFTLCPSGSGPNTIRLWEAALNGSIPVILSETWRAPGDAALWEKATVRCGEDAASIAALPDRLAAIARDSGRLRAMRMALLDLVARYGPDGFVDDILDLMSPDLDPAPGG